MAKSNNSMILVEKNTLQKIIKNIKKIIFKSKQNKENTLNI